MKLSPLVLSLLATPLVAQTTERVTVATGGVELPTGGATTPSISGDGRYAVFSSSSLLLTTSGTTQVFVHDRATNTTTLLTKAFNGAPGNGSSGQSVISADGQWVAFVTNATNFSQHLWLQGATYVLDRDADGNGTFDDSPNVFYAVRGPQNLPPNSTVFDLDISHDGAYLGFSTYASNLVPGDFNGQQDVFRWERASGAIVRASVSTAGVEGNGYSRKPSISDDGNLIAFETVATTLWTSTSGGDVMLHDVTAATTSPVSVSSTGVLGNGGSLRPDLSGDGLTVAFVTYARNFDPRDTDFHADVYVRDLVAQQTELVSVDSFGNKGVFGSTDPAISFDGNRVCFASQATNLWWNDVFAARDVFVRDRAAGWTRQVSLATDGEHGNNVSGEFVRPALSADGRHPMFHSYASNLVPNDNNGTHDLFVRALCVDGGDELGFTLAGLGALTPAVTACGPLSSSSPATLTVANARPLRPGAVFWSLNQTNQLRWGGTLVPGGPRNVVRFFTDAAGKAQVSVTGHGIPGTAYLHAVVRDGGAPGGVAFANALSLPSTP
jgi:Tol biopolymer transport system component